MNSKIKTFLTRYHQKMPSNDVPFELKQRLSFSEKVPAKTSQMRRPWAIMLNTYIVAVTTFISAFTFWQLGEDSLFIWSIPSIQQQEVIPPGMVTYLEDNTEAYLSWSIFRREYPNEAIIKFYFGMNDDTFYLFTYIEPSRTIYVRINSDEGQFSISGSYDEINYDKAVVETTSNVTVSIYILDGDTEINDEYIFRIPKYLELFNV